MVYAKRRGGYRRGGRNYGYKPKNTVKNKVKKMVGEQPSIVDTIASGVGKVAELARVVAPVVGMINTEKKYYDETAAITSYGTSTNYSLVTLSHPIVEGTGDSERIGNSILAQDIQLRLAITMPISPAATPPVFGCFHRFILFVRKENASASTWTISNILEDPTNIFSPINKDYGSQMVVLKDKFLNLESPNAGKTTGESTTIFRYFKIYKPLGFHIRYNDAGSGTDNHIFLLTMSTSTGSANAVNTTYYSRINFTDN